MENLFLVKLLRELKSITNMDILGGDEFVAFDDGQDVPITLGRHWFSRYCVSLLRKPTDYVLLFLSLLSIRPRSVDGVLEKKDSKRVWSLSPSNSDHFEIAEQ